MIGRFGENGEKFHEPEQEEACLIPRPAEFVDWFKSVFFQHAFKRYMDVPPNYADC